MCDATAIVYRRIETTDAMGTTSESWPGMIGQPPVDPEAIVITYPCRVNLNKRIPNEATPGETRTVVGLFIIKFPVIWQGKPVIVIETDRYSVADASTGAYAEYRATNIYNTEGISTSIDVYCEKIV